MAVRSLGFMVPRRSTLHWALRSVRTSMGSTSALALLPPQELPALPEAGAAVLRAAYSSSFFISSRSVSLKAPIRFIMPSQSTSWPSNSGPSTHTNLVLPPTLTRQAPHIPVPSTMIVLSDTSVDISYFLVSRQQNFIMMAGPMAKHLSTFSLWITSSIPTVTTPLLPYDPSSVMMMVSSAYLRTSSSRMMSSLVRPANTAITLLPASLRALMMGSMGAVPTPPPAHRTVPNFSMCVAWPRGPTTSVIKSPSFSRQSLFVERPIRCTTSVMVPRLTSESAMVSGIRSPFSPMRIITK